MASIKEEAQAYEPKRTQNIADLEKVSTDFNLETKEGTNSNGETFKYKVALINGVEYRVPWTVLSDLKAILEKKPNLQNFSVSKKGQGMNTEYTVIPLD